MSLTLKGKVFGAYKTVVRAQRKLFLNDQKGRAVALAETKKKFYENKNETCPEKIGKLIQDAENVKLYLEKHVVQGRQNDRGNFELRITKEHYKTKEVTPSFSL